MKILPCFANRLTYLAIRFAIFVMLIKTAGTPLAGTDIIHIFKCSGKWSRSGETALEGNFGYGLSVISNK